MNVQGCFCLWVFLANIIKSTTHSLSRLETNVQFCSVNEEIQNCIGRITHSLKMLVLELGTLTLTYYLQNFGLVT